MLGARVLGLGQVLQVGLVRGLVLGEVTLVRGRVQGRVLVLAIVVMLVLGPATGTD